MAVISLRRWRWPLLAALIVALLVAAYAWVGFRLAPRWITAAAIEQVQTRYGRTLVLREVQFNPFRFEFRAGELSLPDADGQPLIAWRGLRVNFAAGRSLWRRAWTFSQIEFDAPRIRLVRRADQRFNFQDLLPPDASPAPTPSPAALPRLAIDSFVVRDGATTTVDATRTPEFSEDFTPVSFTLNGFSTVVQGNRYELRASSPNIATLEWRGTLDLQPFSSSGDFSLGGVRLAALSERLAPTLPATLASGQLDVAGRYQLALPAAAPLTLQVSLQQLQVTELRLRPRDGDEEWIVIPELSAEDTRFDLAGPTLEFARIHVRQPQLRAWLTADGELNLSRLWSDGEDSDNAATSTESTTAANPFRLRAGQLHVSEGSIDFESRLSREPVRLPLSAVDLTLDAVELPLAAPMPVTLKATVGDRGQFAAQGSIDARAPTVQLALQISDLDLRPWQPQLAELTSITLRNGRAAARGQLRWQPKGGLSYDGNATLSAMRITDRLTDEDLLKWNALQFNGLRARQQPVSIGVREIVARQPYVQLVINGNGTTNLGIALSAPGSEPAEPAPAAEGSKAAAAPQEAREALPAEIRLVRIIDGAMNFTDHTLAPSFSTGILEMNGTIEGLSGKPDARAAVRIDGKVDRYAPVSITGVVNYFAADTLTDLDMKFENLELTTFSPYAGKFAGYRIDKGKLSITTNYRVENLQLNAKHKIVIDQLQLGERVESPDAVSLPLRLAVALLKDRNGVIDLDLPITGSLDDPQFRVAPIIWKMVTNLLVKAVTAPFALLGSLFGGGDELQFVDFAAGSAALDDTATGKLDSLHKALLDRPGLNLDIPLTVDATLDRTTLTEQRWNRLLMDAAQRQFGARSAAPGFIAALPAMPADYRRVLEAAWQQQFNRRPQIPRPVPPAAGEPAPDANAAAISWLESGLRKSIVISDDALQALAKSRTDVIQAALLQDSGIEPERIFVINPRDAEPAGDSNAAPAAAGAVRLTLSLK